MKNQNQKRQLAAAIFDALESRQLCSVTLINHQTLNVGDSPSDVVYADVNGDGKTDLVVGNSGLTSKGFGIFLNDGTGTFTAGPRVTTSDPVNAVKAFDFTGDGKIDVAVATTPALGLSSALTLYVGNGNGSFTATAPYTLPLGTADMHGADVNNDGVSDLVTINSISGAVSVSLAHRGGGLSAAQTTTTGLIPTDFVIGDFNEDGKQDVVVQSLLSLKFMPGHGDGTFGTPVLIKALGGIVSLTNTQKLSTADLNSDGHLDLAIPGLSTVASTLIGAGDGTFTVGSTGGLVPSANVVGTALGDIDNDGTNDIVSADYANGGIIVNSLDALGDITDTISYAVSARPFDVELGDFDGDGSNEVITLDKVNDLITVLKNGLTSTAVGILNDSTGVLQSPGTSGNDDITISRLGTQAVITRNGVRATFTLSDVLNMKILAGEGADKIDGSAIDWGIYVDAGAGNDSITGGSAADRLRGGLGNDSITGGLGDDRLEGYKGNDILNGGDGNDRLNGFDGNDLLNGSAGKDRIYGDDGNDTLIGGTGNDRLFGGKGNDFLYGNLGTDTFNGDAGKDFGDVVNGELTFSIETTKLPKVKKLK